MRKIRQRGEGCLQYPAAITDPIYDCILAVQQAAHNQYVAQIACRVGWTSGYFLLLWLAAPWLYGAELAASVPVLQLLVECALLLGCLWGLRQPILLETAV